jgi:post-segregation antitoxin (ccd killing protein)
MPMTNPKVRTALNIFLLDDIQAKTKIRMFDVSSLQQITVNFETRHYKSFDKLGMLR